ncbi:MAG: hypothetical protein GWN58_34580 [Anaerolineae bacterium]|nr:hypothetical protein [Anaerolineae bacterium]
MDQPGPQPEGVSPKWILNGFPKAGLHLLGSYLMPIARPQPEPGGYVGHDWAGSFLDSSWTCNWDLIERTTYKLGRVIDGWFLRSHIGHLPDIERFLYLLGVAHVFVYRDLRDVAVSQAHHILSDNEKLLHPGRELFEGWAFEDVLRAVIVGHEDYPGIVERWALYEPWLHTDWVLCVRFEDLLAQRAEMAEAIWEYGLQRTVGIWGHTFETKRADYEPVLQAMVDSSQNTAASPTFREGKTGGWRDVFTGAMCDLFRQHDPEGLLEAAGYRW